jgi:hypothetical protein
MRKFLIAASLLIAALAPAAAEAAVFDFAFSFAQDNDPLSMFSAAGKLDATLISGTGNDQTYLVDAAHGRVTNNFNSNSATINGVIPFLSSAPEFILSNGSVSAASLFMTTTDAPYYLYGSGGQLSAFYIEAGGTATASITPSIGGVPEPAAWVMMIAGFGIVATALRIRRASPPAVLA